LLPVISKVFEKVLNKQLNNAVEDKFIDDNQFGFRNNHSTEHAILKFVDKIEKDLAKGLHVVSVYVDVSKAFDSCDHGILLNKIRRTGLDNKGLQLMDNYLRDRKQLVVVNGVEGGSFIINIGVGQGTILGPTLFKIYIMDMHLCTRLFCVKFADDSSFECSGDSRDIVEQKVNLELEKIANAIFDIASTNKFYSEMYAKLYKELIQLYPVFQKVMDIFLQKYSSLQ
jgi:retron-type reverse transcriptase